MTYCMPGCLSSAALVCDGIRFALASPTFWIVTLQPGQSRRKVASAFAAPLQACSVMPAFPSALWSELFPIANTGTESEIGMYHTVLPLSDLTFLSAGPGAGKLVVGRLRLATTALARETPAEEPEVLE